jgi:hypothetical protein
LLLILATEKTTTSRGLGLIAPEETPGTLLLRLGVSTAEKAATSSRLLSLSASEQGAAGTLLLIIGAEATASAAEQRFVLGLILVCSQAAAKGTSTSLWLLAKASGRSSGASTEGVRIGGVLLGSESTTSAKATGCTCRRSSTEGRFGWLISSEQAATGVGVGTEATSSCIASECTASASSSCITTEKRARLGGCRSSAEH